MRLSLVTLLTTATLGVGAGQVQAYLSPDYNNPDLAPGGATPYVIGPGQTPDYLTTPNWAYSPPLRKFVDELPKLGPGGANALGQYIPVATPDIVTYPGSDYYEIRLEQFTEQMHSDLPNPTTLRGYVQANNGTNTAGGCTDPALSQANPCTAANNTVAPDPIHYLGPLIVSQKDRPIRVKFINALPTGTGGELFIPVDTTVMGAGMFEIDYDPVTKEPTATKSGNFTQNRADLHLHGGRSPWISDGTPHQWITPAGEVTDYPTGVSVENVPDMPAPGPGEQTYYWTNQQSSRMMFYHDHSWGITRLNVYAGEAAGYLIRDEVEKALIAAGTIPADEIPLVIQDKTFVDAATINATDPTWQWGTGAVGGNGYRQPKTGDLWWPHIYMPAQNPFDVSGIAPMGRWAYGPYFWPATPNPYQPIPNPYYADPVLGHICDPNDPATPGSYGGFCQAPEIPSTPNPSWGAEAFMDTPLVNGTAYPTLTVEPKAYRLRVLNAAHDRFFNLSFFKADTTVDPNVVNPNCNGQCATATEIKMLPAIDYPNILTWPATWPADGRAGGIPDWRAKGPNWIMIGNEGGFLPQPVVIPPHPVTWNSDPTTFNAGNVNGGSLILAPAERADVIVDFSKYAGQTLILYNDAPAPWPALDPHYDYYTGAPDNRDMGGADTTLAGFGPNTRTIMQIKVAGTAAPAFKIAPLKAAFTSTAANPGVFARSQDPIIAAQGNMNPTADPAVYETFLFNQDFSAYTNAYNPAAPFPTNYPYWGVSRINDRSINFYNLETDSYQTVQMKLKALQDEQGETFDDYGRMRAALGLTLADPGPGNINFIVQTFSDPSTEVIKPDEIQVWKITHNGVDTHPLHFHLYDVQILNRVGWDGFIRLPDPTELGWKETVRISPLEDTIVALKPKKPIVPFRLPDSYRPLNPATPIGDTTELSLVDPATGEVWATPNVNRMLNFGWEYVWHCHILSHEENDMMRPVVFVVIDPPSALTAQNNAGRIRLTWTDNAHNESGFTIERATDSAFTTDLTTLAAPASIPASAINGTLTFNDSTAVSGNLYYYRVQADQANGKSTWSNTASVTAQFTLSASPGAVTFGNQVVKVASAPQTVTITNISSVPVTFNNIALAGGNSGQFLIQNNTCGAPLAVNASCSVDVVFSPTFVAAMSTELRFTPAAPATALAVGITGNAVTPVATVSPATVSFGNQNTTTVSPSQVVTVQNTGLAPLSITGIVLSGGNYKQFRIVTNNCGATVAAGASCTVEVAFAPTTDGAKSSALKVNVAAPAVSKSVPLSGNGTTPVTVVAPLSLAFGNQAIKTTSAPQAVTVSNTGTGPMTFTGFVLGGPNPKQFQIQSNTCGTTLNAGASCTVNVVFTPPAVGAKSANLKVNTALPALSKTIPLSGSGI